MSFRYTRAAFSCAMYFSAISRCFHVHGKDRRSILRAVIGPLHVQLRWIVRHGEEHLQQLAVRDLGRVVGDLHGLRVPRAARADDLVVRVGSRAAGVARHGFQHSLHVLIHALDAPEATARKHRNRGGGRARGRLIERGGGNYEGVLRRLRAAEQPNRRSKRLAPLNKIEARCLMPILLSRIKRNRSFSSRNTDRGLRCHPRGPCPTA